MVEYAEGIIVLNPKCPKCGYVNETDVDAAGGFVQRADYTVPIPESLKAKGGSTLRRASMCGKCNELFNVRAYEDYDVHYVFSNKLADLIEKAFVRLAELQKAAKGLRKKGAKKDG